MTGAWDILHTGIFFTTSDLPTQPPQAIKQLKLLPAMASGPSGKCDDFPGVICKHYVHTHQICAAHIHISPSYIH